MPEVRRVLLRQRPAGGQSVTRLNHPPVSEQVGQIRPDPPRQGVDRLPPVALGRDNALGNVRTRQRLLCPPERVRYEPI